MQQRNLEYIDRIRKALNTRNEKYNVTPGGNVSIAIFQLFCGLIGFILLMVLVFVFANFLVDITGIHPLIITIITAFIFFMLMGIRVIQLKSQKDKYGDYQDYDNETEEYEAGLLIKRRYLSIPIVDFIAHNFLTLIFPPPVKSKAPVTLTNAQMELALLILNQTENNRLLKENELKNLEEFKQYTEEDLEFTLKILKNIKFISMQDTPQGRNILQTMAEIDW